MRIHKIRGFGEKSGLSESHVSALKVHSHDFKSLCVCPSKLSCLQNFSTLFPRTTRKKKKKKNWFQRARKKGNKLLGSARVVKKLRSRAVFSIPSIFKHFQLRPWSQFFTIRTSQPANNIYLFATHFLKNCLGETLQSWKLIVFLVEITPIDLVVYCVVELKCANTLGNLTFWKRLNRHTIERKQTELHMNVGCGSSNTWSPWV